MVLRALPPPKVRLRLSLQLLLLLSALMTMGGIEFLWKRTARAKVQETARKMEVLPIGGGPPVEVAPKEKDRVVEPTDSCQGQVFQNATPSELRGQIALVTGVAGFIGSHVAQHCLRLGMKVIGLDDLSTGYMQNVPRGVRFVHGNVGDPALLNKLFARYRFDQVYHLAGHGSVRLSHHLRSFTYHNELVSAAHLLNVVVKTGEAKCFVFLSSASVYGDSPQTEPQRTQFKESDTPQPNSPYGIAKLAVELDVQAAYRKFGLKFIIFRAHNVYGPRMNIRDPHHGVIGAYLMAHLSKHKQQPLIVYGDGTQRRAFTYVNDLADVISSAPTVLAAHNQVFNVGSEEASSIADLVDAVKDAMGRELPTDRVQDKSEQKHLTVDHTKFHCVFGDRQWTPLRHGLQQTIPWVMQMFAGLSPKEVADVLQHRCVTEVELRGDLSNLGSVCKQVREVLAVQTIAPIQGKKESVKRWPGKVEHL